MSKDFFEFTYCFFLGTKLNCTWLALTASLTGNGARCEQQHPRELIAASWILHLTRQVKSDTLRCRQQHLHFFFRGDIRVLHNNRISEEESLWWTIVMMERCIGENYEVIGKQERCTHCITSNTPKIWTSHRIIGDQVRGYPL